MNAKILHGPAPMPVKSCVKKNEGPLPTPDHWTYRLLNNFHRFYWHRHRQWVINMKHLRDLGLTDDELAFLASHRK
jgi:hypothetical protein